MKAYAERDGLTLAFTMHDDGSVTFVATMHPQTMLGAVQRPSIEFHRERVDGDDLIRRVRFALPATLATWQHRNGAWE